MSPASSFLKPSSLKPFGRTVSFTALMLGTAILSGCALPKFTAAEQEISQTLSGSKFQPATREFRDNIETQDVLAQAAFWSREHNLNPGDLEAAIKLAAAVRKLGNSAQAIEITQQTRALYPRDPYLAAEYAAALIADQRGADAMQTLDTALRTTPGYARLWSLKGAALDQAEDYELARKHYAKALQITPYDPNILANVGLNYALSGDVKTAEGWLRRAANIPGAGASIRQNLAIVLQLQGKAEEAEKFTPRQKQASLGSVDDYAFPPVPGANTPQTQYQSPQTQYQRQPSQYPPQPRTRPSSTNQTSNYVAPTRQRSQTPQLKRQTQTPQASQSFTPQGFPTSPAKGQSYKSASDAARAAARNQTRKREVRPVTDTTQEQQALLNQLARNVGPKGPVTPQIAASAKSGYYPGRESRTAPPAQAQAPVQLRSAQNAPYQAGGYPTPQYGANNSSTPPQIRSRSARQRRGAARQR